MVNIIIYAVQIIGYIMYSFGNMGSILIRYMMYVLSLSIIANILTGYFEHIVYHITYLMYMYALMLMLANVAGFISICIEYLD